MTPRERGTRRVTAFGRASRVMPADLLRLERSAAEGQLPGSLLLTGTDAAGLEHEARRLAARLLCRDGADAELTCTSCRRVFEGIHPDLFRVEPEGVQIRIDRVREAVAFAAGRPYESSRRVVLVSRAEMLGLEAGNALLKALEEPGARVHWILTTRRPEALLSTILSRCVSTRIPSPPLSERLRLWRSLGRSEEDAADLAFLVGGADAEASPAALERLEEFRQWRETVVTALVQIVAGRGVLVVALLAETLAKAEREDAHVLAELLADAAILAAGGSPEMVRHRAVGGRLRELAGRRSTEALQAAALKATDAPPDNRRGNRRLHFEGLLLELAFA